MYELILSTKFKRNYKRLTRNNRTLAVRIDRALEKLKSNPHHPGLVTHRVDEDAQYGNVWASRATGDVRLIWVFESSGTIAIVLLDVGGHDDVY